VDGSDLHRLGHLVIQACWRSNTSGDEDRPSDRYGRRPVRPFPARRAGPCGAPRSPPPPTRCWPQC